MAETAGTATKLASMDLKPLFESQSIAVIGASRREESVGFALLKNLLKGGYHGVIYPINPKAESILGLKCYGSVLDVQDDIDHAVIVVPSELAIGVFNDCIKKKVRAVTVITAGFKEIGAVGGELQKQLAELAAKHNIPLVGPNCLGVINTDPAINMNASFGQRMPAEGRVAFISQSGALCCSVLDYSVAEGMGFSKFISVGNKAHVSEYEILKYLAKDPLTDVILMYVEDLKRPREMIRLAHEITLESDNPKPIIAIKSGRTAQGAKAASSHTGSLAGSDQVYEASFYQGGIIRADSVQDFFDYAKAFLPRRFPKSKKVALVTNAGGPGIMATDACIRYGLEMAEISEAGKAEMKKSLPPTSNFENPIDVIGDAPHERYEAALKVALKEKEVGGVIVILTPQAVTQTKETAEVIVRQAQKSNKPVFACFMGVVDVAEGEKVLKDNKVPFFRYPEEAVKAYSALADYGDWLRYPKSEIKTFTVDRGAVKKIFAQVRKDNRVNLLDFEVHEILKSYGFPVLDLALAKTPDEAAKFSDTIGYPVVVKISSQDILHKFDVGGVRLNLNSAEEVKTATEQIFKTVKAKCPQARIAGVSVQKMADKGREVILGLTHDPFFGPMVMFGLGGTYVEVLKDVTFRIAPVETLNAYGMIESIKSYKLLEGVRGEKPADIDKIAECIQRLSQLSMDFPEMKELDINPLMVYPKGKGAGVVDARIILS